MDHLVEVLFQMLQMQDMNILFPAAWSLLSCTPNASLTKYRVTICHLIDAFHYILLCVYQGPFRKQKEPQTPQTEGIYYRELVTWVIEQLRSHTMISDT